MSTSPWERLTTDQTSVDFDITSNAVDQLFGHGIIRKLSLTRYGRPARELAGLIPVVLRDDIGETHNSSDATEAVDANLQLSDLSHIVQNRQQNDESKVCSSSSPSPLSYLGSHDCDLGGVAVSFSGT